MVYSFPCLQDKFDLLHLVISRLIKDVIDLISSSLPPQQPLKSSGVVI